MSGALIALNKQIVEVENMVKNAQQVYGRAMRIYIPTKGRADRQRSSEILSAAGIEHVLVTEDKPGHYDQTNIMCCPPMTLWEKRQWIVDHAGVDKFIMLDDDLRFRHRTGDGKFVRSGPTEVALLFQNIEYFLEDYAQVGVTDEFMCNARPRGHLTFGRYNGLLAYNPRFWRSLPENQWPQFRIKLNHDHDFAFQLYALGFPPAILCEFTKSTKFYAKGGLFNDRKAADEKLAHETLAKLWPRYVSVIPSKTSLSGYRISVKWRQLYMRAILTQRARQCES